MYQVFNNHQTISTYSDKFIIFRQSKKNKHLKFMNGTSKVVVAVLAGMAAGAALGLLLAPETGAEMRRKISASTSDLIDEILDKASDGLDALNDLKDQINEKVSEITHSQDLDDIRKN
jgi:gas vesicle protein